MILSAAANCHLIKYIRDAKKAECNITIERMRRQDTKAVQNRTNRCHKIQIKITN